MTIDEEYTGQDSRIRDLLVHLFEKHEKRVISKHNISFNRVGTNSNCHKIAIRTLNGEVRPDARFNLDDFVVLLDKTEEKRLKAFENRKARRKKCGSGICTRPLG